MTLSCQLPLPASNAVACAERLDACDLALDHKKERCQIRCFGILNFCALDARASTLRSEMLSPDRSVEAATKHHNRVAAIMLHTTWYSSLPTARLAIDTGLAKSTIS